MLWHINHCRLFNPKSSLNIYKVPTIGFQTLFIQAIKIVGDSWKYSMLLLYILSDADGSGNTWKGPMGKKMCLTF